ncbi:rolling circle replication-associated protein [Noviherbaspirillum sedimenti]|uniref:Replication-associated protein ORF2/G2P domain-containing protein n=1 Tax=Noviherbaspirillum sedimenti TaxID=2320865 RepID=A0A3A3FXT1_9BURK|nr:hypothetical protein [Noviherbaspirillum sedimenti]RJG00957.1 hypothetical protein D3878_04615 [Noviherbaspirillum sedimenti]
MKSTNQLIEEFENRFYAKCLQGTKLENHSQIAALSDAIVAQENPFKPKEMEHAGLRHARLFRNVGVAAKLHSVSITGKKHFNVVMVTLTYERDTWEDTHMAGYISCVRMWMKRRTGQPLRYIWVAEMQKRGVIHYHALFFMPKGITMPKADKQGWWKHGSTKTERAAAPVRYVMKYASKFDSKNGFPKGARTYGVGGLDQTACNSRRWFNLPAFIKARASISDKWERAVGGGWLERATGKVWPSEWGVCLVTKLKISIVRLYDHGRPLDVGGPFEWLSAKPLAA